MNSAIAYEQNAFNFLCSRDKSSVGFNVVREWAQNLPSGSEVLEIACGGGYPITKELKDAGLHLWAIDSSETLLANFRSRFPDIPTKCECIQEADFFNRKFDAVITVGLMFLLPEPEQENLIKNVSNILSPKGRFLFTAPTEKGKWNDMNTGIECVSLGVEKYMQILSKNGFRIVSQLIDKGGNNYYDAEIY